MYVYTNLIYVFLKYTYFVERYPLVKYETKLNN